MSLIPLRLWTRKKGIWHSIANMHTNMASYDAAVLDGKLLVTKGWFWPFYVVPRGQIYDPKTDHWENMPDGLREGWTGSSAMIYGHLFVVTEHERTKLKVYDPNNDSWRLTKKKIGFYGFFGSLCFF
ncbi:putative galactose oxidase/kelch, beta-propeller, kelch-type beta propeller [Helianthus debilis subsp. tardiflorus]